MVKRTIAPPLGWAGGNRKVRYRGVAQKRPLAAPPRRRTQLRRLIGLGLIHKGGAWARACTQATVTMRTQPGPTGHSRNPVAIHNRHTPNFDTRDKDTPYRRPKTDCAGH